MFQSLFKKHQPISTDAQHTATELPARSVQLFIEHFNIADYFGWHTLDTRQSMRQNLAIGYKINDFAIFSRKNIQNNLEAQRQLESSGMASTASDEASATLMLFLDNRKIRLPISEINSFYIMVPNLDDAETPLPLPWAQDMGLRLIGAAGSRGLPTVDAVATGKERLSIEPYVNQEIWLLRPYFSSFKIIDQRTIPRIDSHVPVRLDSVSDTGDSIRCVLKDFSEGYLRLDYAGAGGVTPPQAGSRVSVEVELMHPALRYRIAGPVARADGQSCVIHLEQKEQHGAWVDLNAMDWVALKAGLLNYVN